MEYTNHRWRGVLPEVRLAATELRHNETPAERLLWAALRRKRLHGIKFRHQHAIDRFILDFYTVEYRLAVEIDGSAHDDRAEYDRDRTLRLNSFGIRVVRFSNDEVLNDLDNVLHRIAGACVSGSQPT